MESLKPLIPLEPGEQYRFHFDMTKCIGCKCCEVACHEQNNNPAAVKWRQVGEIEGGTFPTTARLYISMACNHCLEPTCMTGCPTDTYFKDPQTGAVRMREESCIGCGYCTWNCPYDAPQFNPERNIVTKCDFCHNRLTAGLSPACVASCPSGALALEPVNIAAWRQDGSTANAPAVPEASITISTTRFTVPENLQADLNRIDEYRLKPSLPHYSLVFMTVLTQLSVGGFLSLFLSEIFSHFGRGGAGPATPLQEFLQIGPLAMLGAAGLALATSVFHLGRPLFAWRALKMWRRSWLSREVLFFSLFAGLAGLYSCLRWQEVSIPIVAMVLLGGLVTLTGIAGIYSSARIYMVPARPSWNNIRTPIAFFSTGFLLGPLTTLLLFAWKTREPQTVALMGSSLVALIVTAGLFQLGSILVKLFYILSREEHELRGTAKLLTQKFKIPFLSRLGSLLITLVGVPLTLAGLLQTRSEVLVISIGTLLGLALASELVGRWLFFISVVPKNRPEGYFA